MAEKTSKKGKASKPSQKRTTKKQEIDSKIIEKHIEEKIKFGWSFIFVKLKTASYFGKEITFIPKSVLSNFSEYKTVLDELQDIIAVNKILKQAN